MKRILCYGDSNTWGYTPGSGLRFGEDIRWTGRVQKHFKSELRIIECGMNGRMTAFFDPFKGYLNGKQGIAYALVENKPLDCVIISLGTNDLKYATAEESAQGLDELLSVVTNANDLFPGSTTVFPGVPQVLVISPIYLHDALDETFPDSVFHGKVQESHRFSALFAEVANKYHARFLDASLYAEPSEIDCIHMDERSHSQLAKAIISKLQQML